MNTSTIDYIIVGQGFAGTMLAWQLHAKNIPFIIIDDNHHESSSLVSAGIMNPITGMRLTHNKKYLKQFTYAKQIYTAVGKLINAEVLHPIDVLRFFTRPEEISAWQKNTKKLEETKCINKPFNHKHLSHIFNNTDGGLHIKNAAYLSTNVLLKESAKFFKENNYLKNEKFNTDDIILKKNSVSWKNSEAKKIIFCEGFKNNVNPWFKEVPFVSAKGDLLTIRIEDPTFPQHLINFGKFILPLGDNLYRVGATYIWDNLDLTCENAGRDTILTALREFLKVDFEVVEHTCGIRPIVKDQKPILGMHPKHNQIAIFNGLGSKGALYAPFYARELINHLHDNKSIEPNISVQRFKSTLL
ncbi:MAG: glycine/D-amino acid oxidase-like deaminating enzyme [Lysobacterales bacterium]|jgi:glycine/D-amino acid oxidase-like deaminating enzyme